MVLFTKTKRTIKSPKEVSGVAISAFLGLLVIRDFGKLNVTYQTLFSEVMPMIP